MKVSNLQIASRLLLLAYGVMSLFARPADGIFILCLLLAVSCAFGSPLPENRLWSSAIAAAFIVFSGFFPAGIPFFPLTLLEPFRRKSYLPAGIAAAVLALRFRGLLWLFYLSVGCLFSLLLGLCIAKLETQSLSLNDIRDSAAERRMNLERSNRALREQQDSEIYAATLRERNRIAREIHDNVGHILSRSILMTGALATVHQEESLTQPLEQLEAQLRQAMTSIRESVHDLHDESIDLEQSARLLIRDFNACPASLECSISHGIPRDVKYCFLAILKEALTNVAKHSNATQVEVQIMEHPALYQLLIRDNGTQIHTENLESSAGGMGLENMRQRVRALHGVISVDAANGFRIFISILKRRTACE